jgi:hypothetical protein
MIEVRAIEVVTVRALGSDLLRRHYDEVALNKDICQLEPDWAKLEQLERAGALVACGAWQGEELVGYASSIVTTLMHYASVVVCQNHALFVDPSHRGARVFRDMRAWTKAEAARRGAKLVLWHAKQGSPLDRILVHSCQVQDIIYSERV